MPTPQPSPNGNAEYLEYLQDLPRASGIGLSADRLVVGNYPQAGFHTGSQLPTGRQLFCEDGRSPYPGMFNDGVGGQPERDFDIVYDGLPSWRLDCQGQVGTANTVGAPTAPSATASAGGGTFAGGTTYGYKGTSFNNVGESVGGTEVTATPAAGGKVTLDATPAAGAVKVNWYRTPTVGSGWLFIGSSNVFAPAFVDTNANTPGAAIPVAQTTSCPGRTAATSGVVFKRRLLNGFNGKFGFDGYFRLTSTNLTSSVYPVMALYNRDGTSAWHTRLWLNPMGNNQPMQIWALDGAATAISNSTGGNQLTGSGAVWRSVATSTNQNGGGSHTFNPVTGAFDYAGGWHYVKIISDFQNRSYVGAFIDGTFVDLSPTSATPLVMDQTTSAGAAMMHFSLEMMATTSTARNMHWNQPRGTIEP